MIRLTSSMINNTTLMHINRNMRNLDGIIRTLETTKRVSRPSDDPLVASRALKFRAGVREVQQFQRNVQFGQSWMDITESAFINVVDNQLQDIRRLLVAGANGTYNIDNKTTMINQIRELTDHIATAEMNQTYAGRFVFSGLRTDEQAVFTAPNERRFVATQHFTLSDIDRTASFQRLGPNAATDVPVGHKVNVLRLAYRGIDMRDENDQLQHNMTYENIASTRIHVPGFHVVPVSIHWQHAYVPPQNVGDLINQINDTNGRFRDFSMPNITQPGAPVITNPGVLTPPPDDDTPVLFFVVETGELVMNDATAANFPREGIAATFEKTNFERGEINPAVYFTSREIINDTNPPNPPLIPADRVYAVTQYFSRMMGTAYPAGAEIPTHFDFTLEFPHYQAHGDPEALRAQLPLGAELLPETTPGGPVVRIPASLFDRAQNVSVTYSVSIPHNPTPALTGLTPLALKRDLNVQGVRLIRASVPGTGYPHVDVDNNPILLVPIPLDQAEPNRSFDMHDQIMTIEAASHTHVGINSLAKNVFTAQMFSDLRRLVEFADSIHISDEGELRRRLENTTTMTPGEINAYVDRQLIEERAIANDALYTHFNNMLFLIDRHIDQITREHTQLGARFQRLDMLQHRLEADEVAYERLTSQNEDTDIARAIMMRVNAETAFQASLRANSGIMQLTLANFIN